MSLTDAQQAALKADILADPTLSAQPMTMDGAIAIAAVYNTLSSPDYYVYKTSVKVSDIGDNINAGELVGLTALNLQRLQCLCGDLSGGTINPTIKDRRDAFAQIFSASSGTITRPQLDALWRRLATRVEKLLAVTSPGNTGTRGTTANPDTVTFEGVLAPTDVYYIRLS